MSETSDKLRKVAEQVRTGAAVGEKGKLVRIGEMKTSDKLRKVAENVREGVDPKYLRQKQREWEKRRDERAKTRAEIKSIIKAAVETKFHSFFKAVVEEANKKLEPTIGTSPNPKVVNSLKNKMAKAVFDTWKERT